MSSSNPTSNIEEALSSMNNTSASSERTSSDTSRDDIIPSVFPTFFKEVQAYYAKKSPISSSSAITTPSPVLPPSLLFDPRYFFVPEELSPTKKQVSFTKPTSPFQNQSYEPPSSLVHTPTLPQLCGLGKVSIKEHVKHHEEEVSDLLEYLNELSYYRIEKMEESLTNGKKIPSKDFDELRIYLDNARSQLIKLQQKRLGQRDMIAFAYFRISMTPRVLVSLTTSSNFTIHF